MSYLDSLSLVQCQEMYFDILNDQDVEAMRDLCKRDLFFLLTVVLKRHDASNPWVFARCREVEKAPDGFLDVWAREHYKDLADDTPVLTQNRGWVNHGDLEVGDLVFSPEGLPVPVIALSPRYHDSECYRVTFNDGAVLVAGAGHLWRVRSKHRLRNGNDSRRVVFRDHIVRTVDLEKDSRGDVGVCSYPPRFPSADLPIDPYVLGAWLGDGTSACAAITCAYEDDDIIAHIRGRGVRVEERKSSNENSGLFALDPSDRGKSGGMTRKLRELGVLGNKHIPSVYLTASVSQRMDLLRGLMDTDGHVNTRGTATFTNTNERLVGNVYELAAGLALRPRLRSYETKVNDEPYLFYQVSFQAHADRNPFHLRRKHARAINIFTHRDSRFVASVERVCSVPTRCIQVLGGMYLAGKELVPTHNSTILTFALIIQDILNDPEETIGIFSFTKPIAKGFLRQIKQELEDNQFMKDLFPEVLYQDPGKEAPKWSEDLGIVVKRKGNPKEPTLSAWGVTDGQPTGHHFGILHYDDIVTEESVRTEGGLETTMKSVQLSFNLGRRGGRRRFVGTYYHFNDAYRQMAKAGTVKVRKYPARLGGKIDGAPVYMTEEELKEKRRDMGPYVFSCQMLLDPVADQAQGFKAEWLEYRQFNPQKGWNYYLIVDGASSKKKGSDYTVMVVIATADDKNYYLVDAIRDRLNLTQRADKLLAFHRKWSPVCGYERYGKDSDVEHILFVQDQEEYRFPIIELSGSMPKEDRIRRLVPLFEQGRFVLPYRLMFTDSEGKVRDFVREFRDDEYLAFPVATHDDMLDAISRICDAEMKVRFPQITKKPHPAFEHQARTNSTYDALA